MGRPKALPMVPKVPNKQHKRKLGSAGRPLRWSLAGAPCRHTARRWRKPARSPWRPLRNSAKPWTTCASPRKKPGEQPALFPPRLRLTCPPGRTPAFETTTIHGRMKGGAGPPGKRVRFQRPPSGNPPMLRKGPAALKFQPKPGRK